MTEIHETAPDFTLPATGGGSVTLSELRGGPVVLFFYPRDDTSGCTKESIAFSGLKGDFDAAGCKVFGISKDGLASHDKFAAKHDLTMPAAVGREWRGVRGLWRLEGKEHVRQEIHGHRAVHFPDRSGRQDRAEPGARSRCRATPKRCWRPCAACDPHADADGAGGALLRRWTREDRPVASPREDLARCQGARRHIPIGEAEPPQHPARPAKPELLDPRDVPRRRPGPRGAGSRCCTPSRISS